jgi:hypothetical protein
MSVIKCVGENCEKISEYPLGWVAFPIPVPEYKDQHIYFCPECAPLYTNVKKEQLDEVSKMQ